MSFRYGNKPTICKCRVGIDQSSGIVDTGVLECMASITDHFNTHLQYITKNYGHSMQQLQQLQISNKMLEAQNQTLTSKLHAAKFHVVDEDTPKFAELSPSRSPSRQLQNSFESSDDEVNVSSGAFHTPPLTRPSEHAVLNTEGSGMGAITGPNVPYGRGKPITLTWNGDLNVGAPTTPYIPNNQKLGSGWYDRAAAGHYSNEYQMSVRDKDQENVKCMFQKIRKNALAEQEAKPMSEVAKRREAHVERPQCQVAAEKKRQEIKKALENEQKRRAAYDFKQLPKADKQLPNADKQNNKGLMSPFTTTTQERQSLKYPSFFKKKPLAESNRSAGVSVKPMTTMSDSHENPPIGTPENFWNPHIESFGPNDPRNEVLVDTRFDDGKRTGRMCGGNY